MDGDSLDLVALTRAEPWSAGALMSNMLTESPPEMAAADGEVPALAPISAYRDASWPPPPDETC